MVLTDDITKNIRELNEKVIEYSVDDGWWARTIQKTLK